MEKELKKLKELERQLTLIRDDFSAYGQFVERNIRQAQEIVILEKIFDEIIEAIESLDFITNTERESKDLKEKIITIIKMAKPKR